MPHPVPPDVRRSVDAALEAGDADAALAVLRPLARALAAEHGAGFRALVGRLPEGAWQHDAVVASAMGTSFRAADSARGAAALGYLDAADSALAGEGPGADDDRVTVWLARAAALRGLGRLDEARRDVERVRELGRPGGPLPVPRRVELSARSSAELGMIELQHGRFDDAHEHLSVAAGLADGHLTRAELLESLGGLALIDYFAAELVEADRRIAQARALAADTDLLESPYGAPVVAAELLVALERHDLAPASPLEPLLERASAGSEWQPHARVLTGYVRLVDGRLPEALDELQRAGRIFRGWRDARFGRDAGELLRASVLIALDQGEEAWAAIRRVESDPRHLLCPSRVTARLRLLHGDLSGAVVVLRECEALGTEHSERTLMDVRMLRGAVEFERGELSVSDVSVDRSLATMVRTGSRAPLRAIPAGTLAAIAARALERPQPPEARALLTQIVRSTEGEDRLIEPLSARELLVLAEVEMGSTVAGIAAALFISPNTVKTHLRRLYRKLGVSTRADAIRKAKSLGLGITRESPG